MVLSVIALDDEPVIPGFERMAQAAAFEAESVLVDDLEISPALQQLVDERGGEPEVLL